MEYFEKSTLILLIFYHFDKKFDFSKIEVGFLNRREHTNSKTTMKTSRQNHVNYVSYS